MDEISKIEVSQFKETMSSLEIAEVTGKEHKSIMRDIRVISEQVTEKDGYNFVLMSYKDVYNREQPMYKLCKKECLLLASGYDALLRAKIINRWEELEIKERRAKFPIPQTLSEALYLAASQAKQIEEQQKQLEQAQLEAKDANDHVNKLVHNGKPYTSSEIAKELNLKSAQILNQILSEKGIQYKQNGTWLLYSKYADKGFVSIKQTVLDNGRIIYDRQWTGKGRDFIINLLSI